MDKTIEERAKINATKAIEYACGRRVGEPDYITNLFIQMATEQKAIDEDLFREVKKMVIDKAIKAHCSLCTFKKCCEESKEHNCFEIEEIKKALED